MIKDKIDREILMEGNFVNIYRTTSEKVEVFVDRYDHTFHGEFGGIRVSFDKLKSLLGFEEQFRRDGGQVVSSAVMSLEVGQGAYFIIYVDSVNNGYSMKIIFDGNTITTTRVEFIHQVQTIVATITGKEI